SVGPRPGRPAAEEAARPRRRRRSGREGLVMRVRIHVVAIVVAVVALGSAAHAQRGPSAQFSLGRGQQPHAGVPFFLDLVVEGFDEAPAPAQPKLDIAGAKVTPVGVTPNTSRSIQIVNGRRIDSTRVTWVLRWRVLAD